MGVLGDTPSLIYGVVLEHGLLDRESVRKLIELSIEYFAN